MKKLSEMNDHELLMELLEEKRRNDRMRFIRYGIYGIILLTVVITGFIYIPRLLEAIHRYNALMEEIGNVSSKIGNFVNDETAETFESLKSILEKLQKLLGGLGF